MLGSDHKGPKEMNYKCVRGMCSKLIHMYATHLDFKFQISDVDIYCEMTEKSNVLHVSQSVYLFMMCAGTQKSHWQMQHRRAMKTTYGFTMLGQIVPHTHCSNKQ